MNVKQIRELAQIARENGLSAIEITEGESHVRIERATAPAPAAVPAPVAAPVEAAPAAAPAHEETNVDFNRAREIKSPMVGVFYAAPSPDAKPFVEVGSRVKKGDVVCIVEAMKLMNEIAAEFDGEVVDICVRNGEVVEFGQTLFKLC
ncbi:MAG TPA: acetyl-CoA carboxylase biotin carboxyl carrier protein [Candidatus Pullichristensenella stercorigallinarum]|uniref:Biotin carboxyl carrier protein of acetyl-CoA carboxylase n=1 Tax=Candidatus Pullichristensenella stercorigallinarum TaxID=2840909 RepID=A0A9D1CV49_9FIRM|nr:acetyl-CoA carboxylase biotin carboxyl carrier protein [Candidatus Pullichristensenella stercorigallinarum]